MMRLHQIPALATAHGGVFHQRERKHLREIRNGLVALADEIGQSGDVLGQIVRTP